MMRGEGSTDDMFSVARTIADNLARLNGTVRDIFPPLVPGQTSINSGVSAGGSTIDITDIPDDYAYLYLVGDIISCDTAARQLLVQPSFNNGASFDTVAANYGNIVIQNAALPAGASLASLIIPGISTLAADQASFQMMIFAYQSSKRFAIGTSFTSGGGARWVSALSFGGVGPINALRLLWDGSGDFDGGSYSLVGYR